MSLSSFIELDDKLKCTSFVDHMTDYSLYDTFIELIFRLIFLLVQRYGSDQRCGFYHDFFF